MSIIKLNLINKVYGGFGEKVQALKDINIDISEGDFIGIMGPSGCGKSTLLNILGFLDTPTSGEYIFGDDKINFKKINSLSQIRNRDISLIFQNFALINELSVLDNIILPLRFRKMKYKDKIEKANKYMEKLNITSLKNKKVINLSGGQQQRVAIARLLTQETKVILADEPTGALDKNNTIAIMNLLKNLNEELKKTIVVVTHDNLVASYCDRILNMEDGKLI